VIARAVALKVAGLAARVSHAHMKARVAEGYTRIDPVRIAEAEGIDVIVRPLDKLLGAFLREDRAGILLNESRPAGMFHMTCAHELGHYFLGHGSTADDELDYRSGASEFELEADQFAYSLMAPLAMVARVLKTQGWNWVSVRDPTKLYQLSLRLGLSYVAMVWSLVRLGKLDIPTAQTLAAVAPMKIKRALLPAGADVAANQDVWQIGPNDKKSILEPRISDHVLMELPSHVESGHIWSVTEARSEGYSLKPLLVDSRTQSAAVTASDIPVGGIVPITYMLEYPDVPDSAPVEISFAEVQPWSGAALTSKDGISAFSLHALPELVTSGLGEITRQRLIDGATQV